VLGVVGFMQGTGVSNSGFYTTTKSKGFGTSPAASGTVNINYSVGLAVQGSVAFTNGTINFSGNTIPTATYKQ
jgi:hypothetical protein